MRHFSNIMPNFAAYLHLLVDSIGGKMGKKGGQNFAKLYFYITFALKKQCCANTLNKQMKLYYGK
jgi:hypothetical protein